MTHQLVHVRTREGMRRGVAGFRGVVASAMADICINIVSWVEIDILPPVSFYSVTFDTRAFLMAVCSCAAATLQRTSNPRV